MARKKPKSSSFKLSDEKLKELADALENTADSIGKGLESIGLDPNEWDDSEIEDQLLDFIETCKGCGWWHESGELVPDDSCEQYDDWVGYCSECRGDCCCSFCTSENR